MTHNAREILTRCQSMLLRFCQTQANTYIAASSEYLFKQAEQASGNEAQRRLFEARQAIQDQHESLPRQLDQALSKRFEQLVNSAEQKPASKRSVSPNENSATANNAEPIDELSLLENDEMELKVAISSMSHRAEADCAEALYALEQRIALLNNGIKIEADANPYSPTLFSDCLLQLIETLQLDLETRLILLKLFDRYFLKSMSSVYAETNHYLVSANILPNLRYKQNEQRAIEPKRRKTDSEELNQSENRQAELFDVIRSILDTNQAPINPHLPTVPVERLVAELSALQSQQLMRFQDSAVSYAPPPELPETNAASHQQAIECVGILFDFILNDNTLPDSVKSLLSHLHTPLLKLALLDQNFLSDPKHEGRQLVNSLIGAGEQWVAPDAKIKNDVFPQMQEVVKRIISEFNHENDNGTEVFSSATADFDRYIEKVERKASIAEERSIQAAKGKETLEMGRNKVEKLIQDKLLDELLPKPIVQLISDPWAAFLSYTLLRHGEKSIEWDNAVNVIDSLLWYIEPKVSAEEIQQANELHVDLTVALEHGLTSVGLTPNDIQQHIHALAMCSKLATENVHSPIEAPASHTAAQAKQQSEEQIDKHAKSSKADNSQKATSKSKASKAGSTKAKAANRKTAKAKTAKDDFIEQTIVAEEVQAFDDSSFIAELTAGKRSAETIDQTPISGQSTTDEDSKLIKKRPPNVTDTHVQLSPDGQADELDSEANPASAELVKLSEVMPRGKPDRDRNASDKAIKQVLSMDFGTWLDWNKPDEPERRLKLTWYNQNTQNCMLSNQMGQQVAVVSANDIALGMTDGWISVSDMAAKKPFFERMLETVVDQLRGQAKTA